MTLRERLRREAFLVVLAAICIAWTVFEPWRIADYPRLVDWHTLFALAGLLILTKAVEASGFLVLAAQGLLRSIGTERGLALFLVAASALLSTVLTNDVALFILVPLTLHLRSLPPSTITRLVVFEALAVNAGSALTPIGNPQNLFLWGRSGVSFIDFVKTMAPVVAIVSVALLLLTTFAFGGTKLAPHAEARPAGDRKLLAIALVAYGPFIVLVDAHHEALACAAVTIGFLLVAPRIVGRIDWALLAVIALMFIDLRLVADSAWAKAAIASLHLEQRLHLYAAAVLVSQAISNVPAAILLAEYSRDWPVIAWGVTIGGFGLFVGSLANLIALRLSGQRRAWLVFHAYSLPFLIVVALLAAAWLAWIEAV